MADRVVIAAPTLPEALAEAEELGLKQREVLCVSNDTASRLRGMSVSEADTVIVHEDRWSDELSATVQCMWAGAAR